MSEEKKKLGDAIFVDIDSNEYLNEIHEKILFNYALRLFQLEAKEKLKNLTSWTHCALQICCPSQIIRKPVSDIKCGRRRLLFF